MIDLLGGQVDILCDQVNNTIGRVKGGKIKIIGVTTKKRLPTLPNVPTLHEAGLPNFEVAVWNGLYAPKGTPKAIINILSLALQESLREATLKQRCAELGIEVTDESSVTPAGYKFDALVKSQQLTKNIFFRGSFPLRQVEKVDCRASQDVVFSCSQKFREHLTFYEFIKLTIDSFYKFVLIHRRNAVLGDRSKVGQRTLTP